MGLIQKIKDEYGECDDELMDYVAKQDVKTLKEFLEFLTKTSTTEMDLEGCQIYYDKQTVRDISQVLGLDGNKVFDKLQIVLSNADDLKASIYDLKGELK